MYTGGFFRRLIRILTAANALYAVLKLFARMKPLLSVTLLSATFLHTKNGKALNIRLISDLLETTISNHQPERL